MNHWPARPGHTAATILTLLTLAALALILAPLALAVAVVLLPERIAAHIRERRRAARYARNMAWLDQLSNAELEAGLRRILAQDGDR